MKREDSKASRAPGRLRLAAPIVALAAALVLLGACASTRPVGKQVDDRWITSKVEGKLMADPDVNNFEIDVDTTDGVVRLSGTVETEADRKLAEDIARDTDGVIRVDNELEIGDPSTSENVTDAWIVTKIKAKLTADPEIDPFNIDVDAVRGVVTLSGTVAKDEAREEAVRLARDTRGVKEVRDRIEVR